MFEFELPKNYLQLRVSFLVLIIEMIIAAITSYYFPKAGSIFCIVAVISLVGFLHKRKKRLKVIIAGIEGHYLFSMYQNVFERSLRKLMSQWGLSQLLLMVAYVFVFVVFRRCFNEFDVATWIRIVIYIIAALLFFPASSRPTEIDAYAVKDTLKTIERFYSSL